MKKSKKSLEKASAISIVKGTPTVHRMGPAAIVHFERFSRFFTTVKKYNTVEGILLLADMYQTPLVSELCEDFLIQTTGKTYRKKLQMAIKFNLENLKQFCISMIKSPFDLRSMIPSDISSIDHSTLAALFTKSLTLMK
nr:hypothetical protein F14D2.3 - Caenorhabditis elegans [Caenorhabditis elegans]